MSARSLAVLCLVAAPLLAHAQKSTPLERMAAVVDYVAADYAGAVQNGKIVADSEYQEQEGMIGEAQTIFSGLQPLPGHEAGRAALSAELSALEKDFRARAAEETVARDARAIHKRLIDDYGLVLAPLGPPSLERAKTVYALSCAGCHGATGRADTDKAKELKPPPVSFFDAERMKRVAPRVAFHALTFGVTGTGMASFDSLPASDRWSLAFFTIAMRHEAGDVKRGEAAWKAAALPLAPSPSRLSELNDQQLTELLLPIPEADRPHVLAWLRRSATFAAAPGGTWAEARRLLTLVGENAKDKKRAGELAIAAYLEGVEPHEAMLRARDPATADRVEHAFFDLRRLIAGGAEADAITKEVARVTFVLDHADERAGGAASASVPFFAAFAIALREGFELSLLLAALLAFVRKSGRGDYARYIHLGWAAAVPAGLVTWFAIGAALAGAQRELTEGILTLVAAAMLLFVSHFVLGRQESRKWLKFLEKKTVSAAGGGDGGIPWPLVAVAFVAAYREAIEIVLFFRALTLDAPGAALHITLGAASAVAVLVILMQVMTRLGKRLNPRPLMLVSSILLTAIAVSLVGQGVRSLQEGGYLPYTPLPVRFGVRALGLYSSIEGLGSQLVVLVLVVVPAWLQGRKARAAAS